MGGGIGKGRERRKKRNKHDWQTPDDGDKTELHTKGSGRGTQAAKGYYNQAKQDSGDGKLPPRASRKESTPATWQVWHRAAATPKWLNATAGC